MAANEKVKQATELLEKGVEEVFTSGRLAEYLDVMSRFHSYSARNCMLIYMQMPEATRVAGYKAWQQKFNRQVRKGEKSIAILAPIRHKSFPRLRPTSRQTWSASRSFAARSSLAPRFRWSGTSTSPTQNATATTAGARTESASVAA